MARPTNRLSARSVQTAGAGYHADGAGLYLLVTSEGTASWVFRYTIKGRKREMGMGAATLFSLAEARERAKEPRRMLADGLDPIEQRRAQRAIKPRTWGEAAEEFISAQEAGWRNEDQAAQWRQSLTAYGPDKALPVQAIDTTLVAELLRAIWTTKTETATRVRGRIERIWSAERVAGNVAGENPARWRGHLDALLPKPSKVAKAKHHPAMPYADLPAFMVRLQSRDGLARRALAYTILTAARTNETIGMVQPELDRKAKLWTIPAARMKAERDHIVPLVNDALALIGEAERPFPLSLGGMLALLQHDLSEPYTVHGFRSSFSDWAHEETDAPKHVIDLALAHKISDETDAAYRRGTLMKKRRELMEAWAAYLTH